MNIQAPIASPVAAFDGFLSEGGKPQLAMVMGNFDNCTGKKLDGSHTLNFFNQDTGVNKARKAAVKPAQTVRQAQKLNF